MAQSIADVEEKVAVTFSRLAAVSGRNRAELLEKAARARAYAALVRERASHSDDQA